MPDCPGTHYVNQPGLKPTVILPSLPNFRIQEKKKEEEEGEEEEEEEKGRERRSRRKHARNKWRLTLMD